MPHRETIDVKMLWTPSARGLGANSYAAAAADGVRARRLEFPLALSSSTAPSCTRLKTDHSPKLTRFINAICSRFPNRICQATQRQHDQPVRSTSCSHS